VEVAGEAIRPVSSPLCTLPGPLRLRQLRLDIPEEELEEVTSRLRCHPGHLGLVLTSPTSCRPWLHTVALPGEALLPGVASMWDEEGEDEVGELLEAEEDLTI